MASFDSLSLPFATWQEGLLALAAALSDPGREGIVVARLEATAAKNGIGLKEICALALLVPSRARFDRQTLPKYEPDPRAVALGQMLGKNEAFNKHMEKILDAHDTIERIREQSVFAAFSESDPRRLLKDTIIGFAAAQLADVSRRLGEADPFSRLARRLSLWFKASHDYSRYGIPLAANGRAVAGAVCRALESIDGDEAKRIGQLVAIWSGDAAVEASEDGVHSISSLVFRSHRGDIGELDRILALEAFGSLADEIDALDVDTAHALFQTMKSLHGSLDDGRPATAIFSTWLKNGERFRLAYDPSEAFWSTMYSDLNPDALEPLLETTVEAMTQGGHPLFATGPLPLRGIIFNREGTLFDKLAEHAPEAGDLFRLMAVDGDYGDNNGPFTPHCYWTGDLDPNALMIPQAIDRARERGDHALCDMLIGYWVLYCTLFEQAPLPDLIGLAKHINALPADYRSSTYASLALLKREAADNAWLRRDMDALLSWLPLVDIAPPENFDAFMEDLFTRRLWSTLSREEKQRLIEAEESFVRLRRLNQHERERERFRILIVDWSAVAERFLRRVRNSLDGSAGPGSDQPLGVLIGDLRRTMKSASTTWSQEDRPRMYMALNALNMLGVLNGINTRGGKHLGGVQIAWEDIVYVHAGLYWALRAVLEAASSSASAIKA